MEDPGLKNLIDDLKGLQNRAEAKEFDDYDSRHAAPKVALVIALKEIINKAQSGHYDNI